MLTFKRFLSESADRRTPIVGNYSDVLLFIEKHCSDSVWMLEDNAPLWRGMKHNFSQDYIAEILDPTLSDRKSAGKIPNHYTVLLDNNPYMKDYPKRSRSLIASTKRAYASSFGYRHAIIPFDNVPIGIVDRDDIWDARVKVFGNSFYFADLAVFLQKLIDDPTYDKFKQFDEKLKNGDEEAISKFMTTFPDATEEDRNDFLNTLQLALAPKNTGFELTDSKKAIWAGKATEVWIGGKCVVIPIDHWETIIEIYKELKEKS